MKDLDNYIYITQFNNIHINQISNYYIMQSDENRQKIEYLIKLGMTLEDALAETNLDRSDFTDLDYQYLLNL